MTCDEFRHNWRNIDPTKITGSQTLAVLKHKWACPDCTKWAAAIKTRPGMLTDEDRKDLDDAVRRARKAYADPEVDFDPDKDMPK